MLNAIFLGILQGLTEFLPVSSSGHLVVVPALLSKLGIDVETPDLATSAVLHLGTLIAVLIYYRADVARVLKFRTDPEGKKIAVLVGIGTIPAVIGLPLADSLDQFQQVPSRIGWTLIVTGLVLLVGHKLATGMRTLLDGRAPDALLIGLTQATALIPGISRSGMTIAAGNARDFHPQEAARFSFLLGIPVIAGAGGSQLLELAQSNGGLAPELAAGVVAAALSGYAAIALLLRALKRVGLRPFAIYCLALGILALVVL